MTSQPDNKHLKKLISPRQLEKDVRIALTFLTRIPVPYPIDREGKETQRSLAEAAWSFPLVGILVGGVSSLVLVLALYLKLPVYLCALLAITATILVTGALHEDGLADVADGFGGSHEPARKLEIMKDSRVGSYGVLALCISVLLRTASIGGLLAISSLDSAGDPAVQNLLGWDSFTTVIAVIIVAHVMGRGLAPLIMSHLPLARTEGLAATASKPNWRSSYSSLLITLIILFALLPIIPATLVLISSLVVIFLVSWLSMKQVGGYTGDVLGTAVQLCEIAVYITILSYTA